MHALARRLLFLKNTVQSRFQTPASSMLCVPLRTLYATANAKHKAKEFD